MASKDGAYDSLGWEVPVDTTEGGSVEVRLLTPLTATEGVEKEPTSGTRDGRNDGERVKDDAKLGTCVQIGLDVAVAEAEVVFNIVDLTKVMAWPMSRSTVQTTTRKSHRQAGCVNRS